MNLKIKFCNSGTIPVWDALVTMCLKAYDLIYALAPDMDFTREELYFLCNADEIAEIETEDLHDLVYKPAEKGFLDEEALNNYLNAADSLPQKKHSPAGTNPHKRGN